MLGWEAIVKNSNGDQITRWLAKWSLPNEIDEFIKAGKAELLEKTGGYPDTYLISKEGFCQWIVEHDRMHLMHPSDKDIVRINLDYLLNNDDEMLTLILWDQS